MDTDIRDELREEFERQAEWRREKADEYPDDDRNREAAAIFDRLAKMTKDIDPAKLVAYRELLEEPEDIEPWREWSQQVGFHLWPEDAEELLDKFIANRSGTG